jgi:hypothetical protein
VRGGVSTNATVSPRHAFNEEYALLCGHEYECPTGSPLIVGVASPQILESMKFSVRRKQQLLGVQATY